MSYALDSATRYKCRRCDRVFVNHSTIPRCPDCSSDQVTNIDQFTEHDDTYLRCTKCGECVFRPEVEKDYGETPDTHECKDFDETGGVPARGF